MLAPRRKVERREVVARAATFTRLLDSFAQRHNLSPSDAALLLHVTSGNLKAAEDFIARAKDEAKTSCPVWYPSDDARLLSLSTTDLRAVYQKFGAAEVSRRLVYLADRSLFTDPP